LEVCLAKKNVLYLENANYPKEGGLMAASSAMKSSANIDDIFQGKARGPHSDLLQFVFDSMRDGVVVAEESGRFLACNLAARTLLGLEPNCQVLPPRGPAFEAFRADGITPFPPGGFPLEASFNGQSIVEAVVFVRHAGMPGGRWLSVDARPFSDEKNGTRFGVMVCRDITAQKETEARQAIEHERVENALRESEAFYHSLVENLPQNIFRKDCDGRFTFGNGNYCETVKLPLAELLGKTDHDLFPAYLAQKYVEDDRKVMASGKAFEAVEEHHSPDGRKLYVQVIKTPIFDNQGSTIGTQGMFWDVTQRHQAEEALLASERRYRQLTDATQTAIVVADHQSRLTLLNPAAERMFGFDAKEVLGQYPMCLIPDELQELNGVKLSRLLARREGTVAGHPAEMVGRRKDGSSFPVELALTVIDAGSGPGEFQFLMAARDLTERNRFRAMLVQNEKLASIGLLSAGVAHEINNPLAFVANNLVVLERDNKGLMAVVDLFENALPRLAEVAPEQANQIQQAAEDLDLPYVRENLGRLLARTRDGVDRVTRIVHSLRGLARTDSPKRQDTNLADIIDNSLEIMRGRLKRQNVSVTAKHDPNSVVPCVQTQISQVVLNLLVNAVQAVEATGRTDGLVAVETRRVGDELLIEVADNGTGIDPVNLPKLFDPFFTTKDVGEGTGLGLSIADNIVRGHGGRIEVDSQAGSGTKFRVWLPGHGGGKA
jgi:PAS domain S-box-containing protein